MKKSNNNLVQTTTVFETNHSFATIDIKYQFDNCIGLHYDNNHSLHSFSKKLFLYLQNHTEVDTVEIEKEILPTSLNKVINIKINTSTFTTLQDLEILIIDSFFIKSALIANKEHRPTKEVFESIEKDLCINGRLITSLIFTNSQVKFEFFYFLSGNKDSKSGRDIINFIEDFGFTLQKNLYKAVSRELSIWGLNDCFNSIIYPLYFDAILNNSLHELGIAKTDEIYLSSMSIIKKYWLFSVFFKL